MVRQGLNKFYYIRFYNPNLGLPRPAKGRRGPPKCRFIPACLQGQGR